MLLREERAQFVIRFTKSERALLMKRAKKEGMTESDHLRACMVMEAVMAGDLQGWKITSGYLSEFVREKLKALGVKLPA